jgi:hypothetical protein
MTGSQGYWAYRFLAKVNRVRGRQAAKDWLRPTKRVPTGLERLAKEHHLDLSVEALVLQEPWSELFTEDELNVARERLATISRSERRQR